MFEYILAGFTGSFFSYFCVYWFGLETYAFAKGTTTDKVMKELNKLSDIIERNNGRIEKKMDLISRKLSTEQSPVLHPIF